MGWLDGQAPASTYCMLCSEVDCIPHKHFNLPQQAHLHVCTGKHMLFNMIGAAQHATPQRYSQGAHRSKWKARATAILASGRLTWDKVWSSACSLWPWSQKNRLCRRPGSTAASCVHVLRYGAKLDQKQNTVQAEMSQQVNAGSLISHVLACLLWMMTSPDTSG